MTEKSSIEFIFESGYKTAINDIKWLILGELETNVQNIWEHPFVKLIEEINKMYHSRYLEKGIKI